MTETEAASLRGVWKRYSRSGGWVLRNVDLVIGAGTVHAVLGGNGDGKSTLLRILAGLSSASKGAARRPRRSVSYVPERLPAALRMTAERYLLQMARLRGPEADLIQARSLNLLERLQLSPGPDVPIIQLSKGNRQKVSLAQAFGFPAVLTVLDEPFSGLDREATAELRAILAETRADGRSVVVGAHHPAALEDADAFHRLTVGRLRPAPASTSPGSLRSGSGPVRSGDRLARIELRAVEATASAALLAELPGVRSVDDEPASGQVVVITSDPDGALRTALSHGWSFVRGDLQLAEAEETW